MVHPVLALCFCPSLSRWAAVRWIPLSLLIASLAASVIALSAELGRSSWVVLFTGGTDRAWAGLAARTCQPNPAPVVVYFGLLSSVSVCSSVQFGTHDESSASSASNCSSVALNELSLGFNVSVEGGCEQMTLNGSDFENSMSAGLTMTVSAIVFGILSILLTVMKGAVLQLRAKEVCGLVGPKVASLLTFVVGAAFGVFCILAAMLYVQFLPHDLTSASSPLSGCWSLGSGFKGFATIAAFACLYVLLLIIDGCAVMREDRSARFGGYAEIKQNSDPNSLRNPKFGRRSKAVNVPTEGSLRDRLSRFPPIESESD